MLEYRKICIFGKFIGKINTIFYTNWALIHGFCEVDASPTFHLNGIALRVVAVENVVIILFPASECQKGATLAPAVEGALEVLHAGSITEIKKALYFLFFVFGQEVNQMNQTLSVMAPDRKCQDMSDAGCTRWEVHQQCLLHVASVPAFFGDWPICALTGAIPRIFKRVLSTSSCTLYNYQLFKICCQMIYFIHSWKCTQYTGFLKLAQRGKFL